MPRPSPSIESQGRHPLQIAFRAGVQAVLPGHRGDLLAPNLDLRDIVVADAGLLAVLQVAHPTRVDAHGFDSHTIGGDVIQRGDGDAWWPSPMPVACRRRWG